MIEPLKSEFADDPAMAELLDYLRESMAESRGRLQAAIAARDYAALGTIGHQFKGSGSGFGYPQLTEAGAALETAVVKTGSFSDEVNERALALDALCTRIDAGLRD